MSRQAKLGPPPAAATVIPNPLPVIGTAASASLPQNSLVVGGIGQNGFGKGSFPLPLSSGGAEVLVNVDNRVAVNPVDSSGGQIANDAMTNIGSGTVHGISVRAVYLSTSGPAGVVATNTIGLQCDNTGSLFVKPFRRSQTVSLATSVALTVAATIILPAGAAGVFVDLTNLIITPLGLAAPTSFTATVSDGTNSYVFNLNTGSLTTQNGSVIEINFNPALPASTAATAWTLTLSLNTVTVNVVAVGVLQKAS